MYKKAHLIPIKRLTKAIKSLFSILLAFIGVFGEAF